MVGASRANAGFLDLLDRLSAPRPNPPQQAEGVASEDQGLLLLRQSQQSNLVKFYLRVKPWTIGAE